MDEDGVEDITDSFGSSPDMGAFEYEDGCPYAIGDMSGDGGWHVDDIVLLANCILVEDCHHSFENGCTGDVNGDGEWHVDDIVLLVNCILTETCNEDLSN